jgi:membrane protease YdiL (CAAX protease family)
MIALLATVVLAVNAGWRLLELPGQDEGGPWVFLVFATLICSGTFGVIVLLLRLFERKGPDAIGLPLSGEAWKATAIGTALGAVPITLLVGMALIGGYGSIGVGNLTLAAILPTLLPVLLSGFLLAAWEELALRGYLLRQFSIGINPLAAAVITGVLFGLMHSGNPGANWQGLLYTALGGTLMGWLMVRSGLLWLLIGYHFGWNTAANELFGMELSGFGADASLFVVTLSGSEWLTGGNYGFEASLPAVICEVLVLWTFTSRRYGLRSGRPPTPG